MTPQLCVTSASERQSPEDSAQSVFRVARSVPGCGSVTLEEVMEQTRDTHDTSVNTIAQEIEERE